MQAVDEMVAGRELDALIAEKVMGWHDDKFLYMEGGPAWGDSGHRFMGFINDGSYPAQVERRVFKPSTHIADAWQVVEHIWRARNQDGVYPDDYLRLEYDGDTWHLSLTADVALDCMHQVEHVLGQADTAPLAICRAALAAAEH